MENTKYMGTHVPKSDAEALSKALKEKGLNFTRLIQQVAAATRRGQIDPAAIFHACAAPETVRVAEVMREAISKQD